MEIILDRMNKRYGMREKIINKGQLEFALEKPKIKFVGQQEQYPELYQKAAILMETITKSHPFSDGNKRCAMMAAEYMIYRNNCELVLPLKSIRFSVDIAMDEKDEMREEIHKWFKVHIAKNAFQISVLLMEQIEEESIINNLLQEKKYDEAEKLVSLWMAFDTYPEHKKKWDELVERWKTQETKKDDAVSSTTIEMRKTNDLKGLWKQLRPSHTENLPIIDIKSQGSLKIVGHSIDELEGIDKILNKPLPDDKVQKSILLTGSGCILNMDGHHNEALECLEEALSDDPENVTAIYQKAVILEKLGKTDEARNNYELVTKKNPKHALAWVSFASCSATVTDLETPKKILDEGLRHNPDDIGMLTTKALLSEDEEQNNIIDKILELQPNEPAASAIRAHLLARAGNGDESIKLIDNIINKNPENTFVMHEKGTVLETIEDYEQAINIYENLRKNNLNDTDLLNRIGRCYSKLGKYDAAEKYLNKSLMLNSENGYANYQIACNLILQGMKKEGLAALGRAIKLNPDYKERAKDDESFFNVVNDNEFKDLTS